MAEGILTLWIAMGAIFLVATVVGLLIAHRIGR